ncbi:MAG TPA: ABATE domain-containing protein [Pirellulales bacterium]|jgi:predicted RNA-binding Zn ribbon-like protein|nr:ABATE domain-containing protein [Pirellulales bacterium]
MTSDRPPAFFVADHPALDFLNTTAKPRGTLIDWLGDGNDLVDWLEQAGAIEPAGAATIREWGSDALDEVARQAREFRHWLRGFVTARMGKPLRATAGAVAPLNELLARENSFQRVEAAGRGAEEARRLLLRRVHRWETPQELLVPIAAAAADLICSQDFRLIRSCEGSACILVFLDRTKAHARRWCSMAVCGNRAKAAAHRARTAAKEKRGA